MRCPKCQYLGFEPSPRCKNCGYDFSFGSDDLPSLTIIPEAEEHSRLADFELQLPNEHAMKAPARSSGGGFDLDDLLLNGRSGTSAAMSRGGAARASASAVATPAPEDILHLAIAEPERQIAPEIEIDDEPEMEAEPEVLVTHARVAEVETNPVADIATPPVPISRPEPSPVNVRVASAPAAPPVTTELPLFMQVMSDAASSGAVRPGMPMSIEAATDVEVVIGTVVDDIDDQPLVQVPAVPRPPLAVRRTTPDPAKLRAKYGRAGKATGSADGDLLKGIDDLDSNLGVSRENIGVRLSAEPTPGSLPAGWLQSVGAGPRLSAAALDGLLLASLNVAIIWFTLRVCGMGPSDARLLPAVPIALFFLLVDSSYLVLFTAACGQTIGKMAAGIRVVGTDASAVINDRITVGQAVARSLGTVASFVPLGAGFWMSLVGDGRAMHDRIAHTRVVRA